MIYCANSGMPSKDFSPGRLWTACGPGSRRSGTSFPFLFFSFVVVVVVVVVVFLLVC